MIWAPFAPPQTETLSALDQNGLSEIADVRQDEVHEQDCHHQRYVAQTLHQRGRSAGAAKRDCRDSPAANSDRERVAADDHRRGQEQAC